MSSRPNSAPLGGQLVIRAPNWVGDLVMATPVLEAAADALADPDSGFTGLTILVREHLAPVLAGGALEAHLRPIERGADEARLWAESGADVALLLTSSFGAALRAWRARVPARIGVNLHRRGLLLTDCVTPATFAGRRAATPTAALLRDIGALAGLLPTSLHPRLAVGQEEARRAAELRAAVGLAPDEPYMLCCPGAAFGAAKLWPPMRFAEAIEGLHARRGWRTLVTGGPGEERLVEAVAAAAPSALSMAPFERDLGSLKPLVRDAELLLVGDSGPRWYAAAFDTPCVSVMGPNLPELTATSLELCEVVRLEGLDCAPCLERVCPFEHHACMVELHSDAVIAAAERVLERRERSGRPPSRAPVDPSCASGQSSGLGPVPVCSVPASPKRASEDRDGLVRDSLFVWMPRWLGDVQMAEPALAALAAGRAASGAKLRVGLPGAFMALFDPEAFDLEAGLDALELVDLDDEAATRAALEASDVVLLMRGSFRSAWRAWLAGVPRRIGWARDGRGPLLSDSMVPAREGRGRRILPRPFASAASELAGLAGVFPARDEPRLVPRPALLTRTRERLEAAGLEPGRRFVVVNVGARPGSAKAYPSWAEVITELLAAGLAVVAVTGPGEEPCLAELEANAGLSCGPVGPGRWLPLRAPAASLAELAALGALAEVALTTDGGPRHVLAAAGARLVVLFGPTDARHTASHLERTRSLVGRVPCAPCHLERCNLPSGSGGRERACFLAIEPESVVAATLESLSSVAVSLGV